MKNYYSRVEELEKELREQGLLRDIDYTTDWLLMMAEPVHKSEETIPHDDVNWELEADKEFRAIMREFGIMDDILYPTILVPEPPRSST